MLLAQVNEVAGATRAWASDGVSPSFNNQVWRMSGRLIAPGGAAFSYAATFFRYTEPHGVVLYPVSLSLLDESSGRLFSERRIERAGLGLAEAATNSLAIRVGTWHLRESLSLRNRPTFDLDAKFDGMSLLVHGAAGKPRCTFHVEKTEHDQYSSIASSGTIAIEGRRLKVIGTSWFDHELSSTSGAANTPTAQFRVQLDDGREIYVETSSPPEDRLARRRAFLIERDGTLDTLGPGTYDISQHPGSTWLSPDTHTAYPDVWALHVDGKTEFLLLEPVKYDQESLAHGAGLPYWDGVVDVYDVTPGSQGLRLGSGSVLMYGYLRERESL